MIHLIIGVLDGELTDICSSWISIEAIEVHFPLGEVYRCAIETSEGDRTWRVLQRGSSWAEYGPDSKSRMSPMLLPIKEEDVPEVVRMVALMRE